MEECIRKWKQSGHILCWTAKEKGELTWNFTANEDGCNSLLNLLCMMKDSPWPSKRIISLSTPHFKLRTPIKPINSLIFNYMKDKAADNYWSLTGDTDQMVIEFGAQKLDELYNAIDDVKSGKGDYSVCGDSSFWIWWYVDGMCKD